MAREDGLPPGTLVMLILRVLASRPLHGYAIAQRLQQISASVIQVNQGSLYPALLRLEQRRLIRSKMGLSENNRRARFYSITPAGRRQLVEERAQWALVSGVINRLLASEE